MSNFEHAKYDADGVRIDDPSFNTQALRNDTSLVNGITFPGTNTVAINTNSVERLRVGNEGQTTILAASSSPALKVTQTGAGNAFVVEDVASDTTPFVIDGGGNVLVGYSSQLIVAGAGARSQGAGTGQESNYALVRYTDTAGQSPNISLGRARGAVVGTNTVVQATDILGAVNFAGGDGASLIPAAQIKTEVDGTPGTNDMPGRLVFSTTADGASSPTEALRIDSTQSIINNSVGSGTNAYGFRVTSAKIGGTNNYAFSGEIAAGANRWNLYMSGSARNYMSGKLNLGSITDAGTLHILNTGSISFDGASTFVGGTSGAQILYFNDNHMYHDNFVGDHVFRGASYASLFRVKQNGSVMVTKTVTAGGTTGAQTINKTVGSVNFAAGATTLVVTSSLVDTASVIVATVGTNDATMKSVAVVAAAGSFTLHANAAATAETRVNFCVFN